MTRQEQLATGVRESADWLARYLKGFDDTNHTRQATHLPNHVAWNLGHLALILNVVANKLDGEPMPAGDFAERGPGDPTRFGIDAVKFGSSPADDVTAFPRFDRCVQIFRAATARLATAVERASDGQLDQSIAWGRGIEIPMHALIVRMIFHNGTHCGQIADLRRVIGIGSIFA